MKRKAYGRDAGLSLRMLVTGSLLGLLYVVFAVVLFQVLNVGLVPMLVIVLVMTVASFFAMLAGMLTGFGLYAGMFGGGGRRDNNNGPPVWLIVLLVSIVTYFISQILILAISRYREYAADRGSALITGAPEHLMSALQKISSDIMRIPQRDLRQVETMNAFFIIPASVKGSVGGLFLTHPPLEKRLAALGEIAPEMGRP